jgi:hypothetical protein
MVVSMVSIQLSVNNQQSDRRLLNESGRSRKKSHKSK